MDKFAPSMKKKLKSRLINREKQWPPRHSNKLVRLQLVKGEGCSAQRGREDKTVKRIPLAYGDLFKGESGKERVRKVLVEGDAGIGKTTLTISLSEDWARGELFQEFELLLLLSLRHKKVALASSLRELLKLFHSSQSVCESVASYLEEEEAENVLIIADGWDELGESERREGSFLYQLLFKMFPLMSVVVTSRPSASAPLHNLPCIDRFVEVSGFSKDDIKEYIQSEFSSDQEKARRLLEQLEHNPLIESTCSVPLNCAIVCHLWHTLEEALPSTMTQLYTKIILYVVCRNLRKLEAYGPTLGMSSFDELPEGLQQSWWLLCQFACEALDKDEIVFSKKELLEFFPQGLAFDDKILCFGLLQAAETVLDVTCVVSFNFVHLTFMEYLAALYISRQPLDRQLQFLQKSRFTMVARFLFGICFSISKSVTQNLHVEQAIQCVAGRTDKYTAKLSLCHCAFEAQNNSVNDRVAQFLIANPSLIGDFGFPRTAHDCAAVLYVIDNMQECSRLIIDFSNSGISVNQIKTLTDVLASKHGKLQVKRLDLNGNKLTDKSVSDLFHKASVAFQSLTYLDLSGANTNATFVKALSAHCPHLRRIDLSQNNLGVPGATALAQVISRLQHQSQHEELAEYSLCLNQTNLGDNGLCAFIENLDGVCHLNCLALKDDGIHVTGVTCLADAVCSGKIILPYEDGEFDPDKEDKINLSDNPLGLEGTVAIGRMLSSNYCQSKWVDLSRCELTTAGGGLPNTDSLNLGDNITGEVVKIRDVGQQLCQMPHNNTITWLELDGNGFTGEGIHILAGFMCLCPCLEYLSSCNCGITSDDLKQLLDKLSQLKSSSPSICSKLQSWNLDTNEIDDSDVLVLMDQHPTSLFPSLGCGVGDGIDLSNNPVSKMLEEELRRHNESPESSSDGLSDQEDSDFDEEEESLSFTESSSDGDTTGEEQPLSEPLPPPRPHPLTTLQCADVHRESLDGSGGRGNARVGPDSEPGEPAMEVQTTVNQSPLQNQVLTECHNNVSVSSLPDEPGPPPNKMRRLKDIEPPEELLQLTTDAQKVVKSGQITDPDRLFKDLAELIFDKYTEIGIDLGLKISVLTNELETGEVRMLKGSRKALKMLQLWQQSVTKGEFTYSVLAAALEKNGHRNCAYKYCYTTDTKVPACVSPLEEMDTSSYAKNQSSNLIGVFERAGYQGYADTVHKSPPDHTSYHKKQQKYQGYEVVRNVCVEEKPLALVPVKTEVKEEAVTVTKDETTLAQPTAAWDLRGVEVCGEMTVVVHSSGAQRITWEGFGLKLHIDEGSLPAGIHQCTLTIKASLAGQYEFPDNSYLVSAIFWLRCEPMCKFTKPVTVEMQHCARSENVANLKLKFVRAVCSQKQLPYTFKELGGEFTRHSSYGVVEVNGFSGLATTQEGSEDRTYLANLLYKEVKGFPRCIVNIYIAVIWDLDSHYTVMIHHFKEFEAQLETNQTIEFELDQVEFKLLNRSDRLWSVNVMNTSKVKKKDVDQFVPGKTSWIPYSHFKAKFSGDLSSLCDLECVVDVVGVRDTNKKFNIDITPEERPTERRQEDIEPIAQLNTSTGAYDLDGSGGRGNARVGPDSEGEPAMEVQTTVNQSPLQNQVLTECPNNVSVSNFRATKRRRSEDIEPPEELLQPTTTTKPGPSSAKRRRLENTERQKPLPQLTTTTDEVKPKKMLKSGQISDPDCLFTNIAKHVIERYTEVGIQLGLKGEVLTNELETGEFRMLKGSRKALKMLQLWRQSVTEDEFSYSVLAAALEKEGFKNCADKYCYTTELNQ